MKWYKKIIDWIESLYKDDPIYNCDYYRENGCSFVDGYLCDYPNCSLNKAYKKGKEL